jgi:hypothetical protein
MPYVSTKSLRYLQQCAGAMRGVALRHDDAEIRLLSESVSAVVAEAVHSARLPRERCAVCGRGGRLIYSAAQWVHSGCVDDSKA